MAVFLDHVESCRAICADLLTDYLKPDANPLRTYNDFARGKKNQITQCLLFMAQKLEEFTAASSRFTTEEYVSLRAEFFLTAIGETALKNADDMNSEHPSALEEDAFERMWANISKAIKTETPSKNPCFEDFAAYSRGCEAGSREFRKVILPSIIRNYKKTMEIMPDPSNNVYRM